MNTTIPKGTRDTRRRRARLLAEGKCVRCGVAPAATSDRCVNCKAARLKERAHHRANGLCSEECANKAAPGSVHCQRHLEMMRAREAKRRARRKAAPPALPAPAGEI